VILSAIQTVDESSTAYLIGYWGARIGIPLVVVVLVGRFIIGQVRGPRTPTSSGHVGVTSASLQAQWPAPPMPAQWPAPPAQAQWPAPPVPAPVPWTAPPVPEGFTQPVKGKHAR
jgi:hypothetical protein